MPKPVKSIKLDVTNLDRTTILGQIRYAYRTGHREIQVTFKNTEAPHLRKNQRYHVRDIITQGTVRLLLGVRVQIIDEHNILLHVKESKALDDLQQTMRQTIIKLTDMHHDLLLLIQGHLYAANSIEEKHDSVTRLVSHCTRMLNKTTQSAVSSTQFHIMANVDKIADIIKYMSRDYLTVQKPMSRTSILLMKNAHACIEQYKYVYTKGTLIDISRFSLQRDEVKRQMRASLKNMNEYEAFLLGQETSILEVLTDMTESTLTIKNNKK